MNSAFLREGKRIYEKSEKTAVSCDESYAISKRAFIVYGYK